MKFESVLSSALASATSFAFVERSILNEIVVSLILWADITACSLPDQATEAA